MPDNSSAIISSPGIFGTFTSGVRRLVLFWGWGRQFSFPFGLGLLFLYLPTRCYWSDQYDLADADCSFLHLDFTILHASFTPQFYWCFWIIYPGTMQVWNFCFAVLWLNCGKWSLTVPQPCSFSARLNSCAGICSLLWWFDSRRVFLSRWVGGRVCRGGIWPLYRSRCGTLCRGCRVRFGSWLKNHPASLSNTPSVPLQSRPYMSTVKSRTLVAAHASRLTDLYLSPVLFNFCWWIPSCLFLFPIQTSYFSLDKREFSIWLPCIPLITGRATEGRSLTNAIAKVPSSVIRLFLGGCFPQQISNCSWALLGSRRLLSGKVLPLGALCGARLCEVHLFFSVMISFL